MYNCNFEAYDSIGSKLLAFSKQGKLEREDRMYT